ncbi:MAG: hypothetical protein KME21_15165 [Desmonostoc vinosum HA7617-LM4]|jgi:ElaB/YqjD/DUF883 family membrane-anchored ribosome-binding protein|nr:hypothetical protein [Desmonostoc vinosum HA7617-LM4]
MTPPININLPPEVLQRWQTARDFVNQNVSSLTNSAQQVGETWQQTATQATDRAIDRVTTTLENGWQTAEQIQNTTSTVVQGAVASSVNDWLTQHPGLFRLVQILGWTTNHPIISLVILLVVLAVIWSIIKAIVRLIETASWSILQVPFKLILTFIKVSFVSLTKVGRFTIQRLTNTKITDSLPALIPATTSEIDRDKQQRLAEISSRLAAIQQEQNQLLQEAADLIDSQTIEVEIAKIKPLKTVESYLD